MSTYSDIHMAARLGTVEDVIYFIENGADVNAQDIHGSTPLHIVAEHPGLEIAQCLVYHDASIDIKDNMGESPLHKAVWLKTNVEDNVKMIHFLVSQGADVNTKNRYGMTPLHKAVDSQNNIERTVDIVQTLVSLGAQVNTTDMYGWTPLHSAAKHGESCIATMRFLLTQEVDVNVKDSFGYTPLHKVVCCYEQRFPTEEILRILISLGAEVNTKCYLSLPPSSAKSAPPLYHAKTGAISQLLREAGAMDSLLTEEQLAAVQKIDAEFSAAESAAKIFLI